MYHVMSCGKGAFEDGINYRFSESRLSGTVEMYISIEVVGIGGAAHTDRVRFTCNRGDRDKRDTYAIAMWVVFEVIVFDNV